MRIKLILIVSLFLAGFANLSIADFGSINSSCTALSPTPLDSDLLRNSAYGHLIDNIDMTTYVTNACDPSTSTSISFCVRNSGTLPCTLVAMNIGDSRSLGEINSNPELGGNVYLANLMLTAAVNNNKLCVTMPTPLGQMPIACKNISVVPTLIAAPDTCSQTLIGSSCYSNTSQSQSVFSFSGQAVSCLSETLNQVFYSGNQCKNDEMQINLLSPFASFAENLKITIRAALIIYTIFFGFSLVMNEGKSDLSTAGLFIIKILFVAYFALGIGPIYYQNGNEVHHNGMTEIALPLLTGITNQLAQVVFQAGQTSDLCSFDISKYNEGYQYYALWDAIDCRIGYYTGLQILYNNDAQQISGGIESLKTVGGLPFFSVLFGFFMAGNIVAFVAGLVFIIMFLALLLQFITIYMVCLITIYALVYVSPIFICFVLFKNTKQYFDAWTRLLISCSLQPAVVASFIAAVMLMYDDAIFNSCNFVSIDNGSYTAFELDAQSLDCQDSAGYKLTQYYKGFGWSTYNLTLFQIPYLSDSLLIIVNLIYVLIFTIIFYYFSKYVADFASSITGGIGVGQITISPEQLLAKAQSAASAIQNFSSGQEGGGVTKALADQEKEAFDSGKKGGSEADGGESTKDFVSVSNNGAGGESGDMSKMG